MATNIDPDCHAGIDCEGCSLSVYCPQRDDERKRRQSIAGTLNTSQRKTVHDRYEIGSDEVGGMLCTRQTLAQAEEVAREYVRAGDKTVEIFDRMARCGQPQKWTMHQGMERLFAFPVEYRLT